MPITEVQNLRKEYTGKKALIDINFKVENGEIFALIGPNGAGKTTLLHILDLLDEPSSGTVWFQGVKVNYSSRSRQPIRRKIGMVFQKTVLFNTSVFKNVAYALKVRGENDKNIAKRVKEAVKIVQLEGFENKNALKLSGGEAQRVALAQALITEPELLLLDEPTANLDPRNVSIVEEVLSWINREHKTTIIMATHNMFQAETLANRAALLLEGRIEKIGKIPEIFTLPSKTLTKFARLENVFSGVSRISKEGTSIINIGEGVQIEATVERFGQVTVFVRPEDIILSRDLIVSSARNMFKGRIIGVSDFGSTVKLQIDAGKQFVVQITKRSFNEMQLNVDSEVYLAFKASSVHLI
jgi:tungstate transport system ATP-binding protein